MMKQNRITEINTATVFKCNIWFTDKNGEIDHDHMQQRFVVAETEEMAEMKLNEYREKMIENGISNFIYTDLRVELENVIF